MTEFETGAVRDTGGKGRMDLLPMCSLIRVAKHMEDALTHYPERNWEKGLPMHSMLDSAIRHLFKYMDGMTDEDHLCAAATNLLMAMWTEEKRPDMQDIVTRNLPSEAAEASSAPQRHTTGIEVANNTPKPGERQPEASEICPCWHPEFKSYTGLPQCYGTREKEGCTCNGDRQHCDFYEQLSFNELP